MTKLLNPLEKKQRKAILSRRIKEVREQKGLSQNELAWKIHCTQGLISLMESGSQEPKLSLVIEICDALGCSVDYLLGRDVDYSDQTSRGKLLKAFEMLTSNEQNLFADVLSVVAEKQRQFEETGDFQEPVPTN